MTVIPSTPEHLLRRADKSEKEEASGDSGCVASPDA